MKKLFWLITVTAVALILMLPAAAENLTFEDYSYTINSDGISVTITDYTGSATELTIPDEINGYPVTALGDYAFSSCSSLTSVVIPESVTTIGKSAFSSCSSLTSVVIPESVTSVGNYAFRGCSKLLTAGPIDGDYNIEFGWTTKIPDYAFYSCSSLTSVVIPKSVTSIGLEAFSYCSSLTSVVIPESVTYIGSYALNGCSSLTSVVIMEGVTSIGSYAFYGCSSLTSVVIPESVTSIGSYAFYDCSKLLAAGPIDGDYNIKFGWKTKIPEYAFSGCSGLTSVVIPESVTSIGLEAFSGCSSLTSVVIPKSVTSIGLEAFSYCSSLTSVVIPESVTSIGGHAFRGCSSLTSVVIMEGVTSIGSYAFYGCSSLTSVVIQKSVTSIGREAFYNCSSLTDVYYTGTEEEWDAITISLYNGSLTSATIHYNSVITPSTPEIPETPEDIPGTVKYLYSWDAASGKAVFGVNGIECSAAEGAEVGAVSKGNFVLVVENASNFLLFDSISPVESRLGTVDSVDSSSFTIDGTAYAVTKNLADIFSSGAGSDYLCGSRVLYHLSGSCIVGITVLTEKSGSFTQYDTSTGCLHIDDKYYMNSLTDISFLASISQIIGCNVSILTDGTFVYSLKQLDTEFREVRKLESYNASTCTAFFADGISYLLADVAEAPGNDLIGSWVICNILSTSETGPRLTSFKKIEAELAVTVKMDNEKDILYNDDGFAFEGENYVSKTDFEIPFTVEIENVTYSGKNAPEDFINEESLAISISSVEVSIDPNDLKIKIELDDPVTLKPGEKLTGKGIVSAGLFYEPEEIYNFYSITAEVKSSVATRSSNAEFTILKEDEWKFSFLKAFSELSVIEASAQSPVLLNYFSEKTVDDITRTISFFEFLRSGEVINRQHCLKITCLMDKEGTSFEGHEASLYFWIPTGIMDVIPAIKVADNDADLLEGISLDQIRFQMIDETDKAVLYPNELLELSVSANVSAVKSGLEECFKAVYGDEIEDFCYEVVKAGLSNVVSGISGAGALSALETGKILVDVYSDFKDTVEYFEDVFSFSFDAANLINYPTDVDIVTVSDMEQAVKKITIKTSSDASQYRMRLNEADFEIHIYDSNGWLCAVVNNDTLICLGDDTGLSVVNEGDVITLCMYGKDFTFDIVASRTTTISYTIEEYAGTDKTRLVCFENVELQADTAYKGAIPQSLGVKIVEYAITADNGDTIEADRDLFLNSSGDVNDDGRITSEDAEILSRYFAGNQNSGIVNWNAADVDGDGTVTRRDTMILARYLADWEGYTLPYSVKKIAN